MVYLTGTELSLQEQKEIWKKYSINYIIQDIAIAICKHNDDYLILRFRNDYIFCPGDWDFFTFIFKGKTDIEEILLSKIKEKLGVNGKILQSFPKFEWVDYESKVIWNSYDFLIEIDSKSIVLKSKKFSEFKWIKLDDLKKYSRLNYFEDVLEKTLFKNKLK